jgi:hypothetical protein
MKTEVDSCLICAMQEMNAKRERKIPLQDPASLILYGEGGVFDSMELVNFLMLVEENLTDSLDVELSLTSERAVSRRNSPFRSMSYLSDFILEEVALLRGADATAELVAHGASVEG